MHEAVTQLERPVEPSGHTVPAAATCRLARPPKTLGRARLLRPGPVVGDRAGRGRLRGLRREHGLS